MNENNIILTVYSSAGKAISNSELENAEGVTFSTCYPGGLFSVLGFFLPRDVTATWAASLDNRIAVRNGQRIAWEGYVANISVVQEGEKEGFRVSCLGAWANFLENRHTRKSWADTRIDENIWRVPITAYNAADITLKEFCGIDREARIRFTPRSARDAAGAEAGWSNTWYARVVYTAPTGQTIKRVTASFDLQEGAQQWIIGVYNQTSLAAEWTRTTTGTGTFDQTLATPAAAIWLYFQAGAAQTPATDGTMYGEFSNIVVYTETGSINGTEIIKDIRPMITELSTDTDGIGTNALSLVPFYLDGFTSYADVLSRVAGYGDSSYNPWAVYIGESAGAADAKPKLYYAQQPSLTSAADYRIRLSDKNLIGTIEAEQDISTVVNWVNLEYQDVAGMPAYVTPDDDATLKDTTSIGLYGQREGDGPLAISTTDATLAKNYALRYLAQNKDPQWIVSSGITVKGYIRSPGGVTPACEIRAGKTIRIENWLNNINGTGLTFLITETNYSDDDETCRISVGRPNSLDVWMARNIK